ncbi:hypothetical protein BDV93DRAFT_544319, partial [Ceratobasidium sp. AG-I]
AVPLPRRSPRFPQPLQLRELLHGAFLALVLYPLVRRGLQLVAHLQLGGGARGLWRPKRPRPRHLRLFRWCPRPKEAEEGQGAQAKACQGPCGRAPRRRCCHGRTGFQPRDFATPTTLQSDGAELKGINAPHDS